jgi:hypothetical protein
MAALKNDDDDDDDDDDRDKSFFLSPTSFYLVIAGVDGYCLT